VTNTSAVFSSSGVAKESAQDSPAHRTDRRLGLTPTRTPGRCIKRWRSPWERAGIGAVISYGQHEQCMVDGAELAHFATTQNIAFTNPRARPQIVASMSFPGLVTRSSETTSWL
jgi:hypothetical protein